MILKKGLRQDYEKVYEYDFRHLRNINGDFEYIKLAKQDIQRFDTYADNNNRVFDWIVFLKDNNETIANIVADREQKNINAIELSFNMHPDYWRNGYMSEAIIIVLKFLFEYGFENVICGYDEGNIKSKNISEKLGFELFNVEKKAHTLLKIKRNLVKMMKMVKHTLQKNEHKKTSRNI